MQTGTVIYCTMALLFRLLVIFHSCAGGIKWFITGLATTSHEHTGLIIHHMRRMLIRSGGYCLEFMTSCSWTFMVPPFSDCLLVGEKPSLNGLPVVVTYNIHNVGPQRQCMPELGQVIMAIYSRHNRGSHRRSVRGCWVQTGGLLDPWYCWCKVVMYAGGHSLFYKLLHIFNSDLSVH